MNSNLFFPSTLITIQFISVTNAHKRRQMSLPTYSPVSNLPFFRQIVTSFLGTQRYLSVNHVYGLHYPHPFIPIYSSILHKFGYSLPLSLLNTLFGDHSLSVHKDLPDYFSTSIIFYYMNTSVYLPSLFFPSILLL